MPDYPYSQPPSYPGPQFPFSRALTSGPLADLVAGVVGAPGDLQQMMQHATPQPAGVPSPGAMAPATLPTMDMISRAQADQTAQPRQVSFQSMYAMLPEMAMLLRGAPTPEQVPSWIKQLGLANIAGAPGEAPPWANALGITGYKQQPSPTAQPANPEQGWTLGKFIQDAIGGAKPAY